MNELWPKTRLDYNDVFRFKRITINEIEDVFQSIYPNVNVVLMPSARSGITSILELMGASRNDHVFIPPYASHCVLNAISYLATPSPFLNNQAFANLICHQWGFVSICKKLNNIIEDSVDSLIVSAVNLFPNDGRFELLSLSKILGCFGGGLIICQKKTDSDILKKIRDSRKVLFKKHFYNKLLSNFSDEKKYSWNNLEPLNGYIPKILLNNIYKNISNLSKIIDDRKKKINLLKKNQLPIIQKLPEGRLVNCWPYPYEGNEIFFKKSGLQNLHFVNSSKVNEHKLTKAIIIPLHKDFSEIQLNKVIKYHVLYQASKKQIRT